MDTVTKVAVNEQLYSCLSAGSGFCFLFGLIQGSYLGNWDDHSAIRQAREKTHIQHARTPLYIHPSSRDEGAIWRPSVRLRSLLRL